MLLALGEDSERIQASPDTKGTCPVCGSEMISKCGEIKVWHWAHKSVKDCDKWSEPEGDWHYGWKKWAGLENTEIVIKKNDQIHRADIQTPAGMIIELQHSPLATKEVREREEFYGNMAWVIDGDEVCNGFIVDRMISKDDTFYFQHSGVKKAWVNEITKPAYYHFSRLFFYTYYWRPRYTLYHDDTIRKRWERTAIDATPKMVEDVLVKPDGKYCKIIPRNDFLKRYFPAIPKQPPSLFDF